MDIIRENASFIRHACQTKNTRFSAYETKPLLINEDSETLKYLGVASMGVQGAPFISLNAHRERNQSADAVLLAERFSFPNCYHTGAGRHVLLKNVHLKGIGRNILSINEDYSHSWGGLLIKDALKGYLTSNYLEHRTLLPPLKINALFLYAEPDADGVPMVVAMRDASSFRIAQADPKNLNPKEKALIRNHLFSYFQSQNPHLMLDKIIENYIHAYSVGVKHKAISPDNLLVDGRWMDTESIDINITQKPFDEWLTVSIESHEDEFTPIKNSLYSDNLYKSSFKFIDSWVHQLFVMAQLTHQVYSGIFEAFDYDVESRFFLYLEKYFSHVDLILWKKILNDYQNNNAQYFNENTPVIHNLRLRGYFFNSRIKAHQLTFGSNTLDSSEIMENLTNRWEKAFWPVNKDWQSAYELAHQIKKMCDHP